MKYKPRPFYRSGFLDSAARTELAGRMLPQPLVETVENRLALLDEVLGNGFWLVSYGPDPQQCLEHVEGIEPATMNLRRLAIVPIDYNIDRTASQTVKAVRDVNDQVGPFIPNPQPAVMLPRPDRFIAVATLSSVDHLANSTRLLLQSYRS